MCKKEDVYGLSVIEIFRDVFKNCPQLTIYAEAVSKPEGWVDEASSFGGHLDWNSDDRPVVWGYKE